MRLTDEQQYFATAISEFARRECGTREQWLVLTDGGREMHSRPVYKKLADAGYVGVGIPEVYGGSGGGLVEQCLFFEEVFRGQIPVHGAGPSHTVAGIYKHFGSDKQKHEALAAISDGAVMSISLSEPEAGSDAAAVSCRADKVDGGYVINGQKTWCTDAHFAERIILVARTSRGEKRHHGLTMFEIDANTDGLAIHPIETMAGSEVNDLYFTDLFVPEDKIVGGIGDGWSQVMAGLNGERLVCAAQQIGHGARIFTDLVGYIDQRKQFGRTISSNQAVRHRIADLALELEAARVLTYDVMDRVENQDGSPSELIRLTSMAKIKATETAKTAALEGVQLMGGYGYAVEYGMERHLRNSIAPTIYAGTNEIQRDIIASTYLRGDSTR